MDRKAQIDARIKAMQQMGLVDEYLSHTYSLRDDEKQLFISVLQTFMTDTNTTLEKLEAHMSQGMVDFPNVYTDCIKLLGGSGSVGAIRMRIACLMFREALSNRDRDGCIQALNEIKREYLAIKPHLEDIGQMERALIAEENKR